MAYKDLETQRAAARRWRERNPGYGRAQYAKHAEKRRAEKIAAYHADVEAARQVERERYARNATTVKEQQRVHRAKNKARALAQQKAWRDANPERETIHAAKRALRSATGLRMREIPDDLAAARVLQIEIRRFARSADAGGQTPP